MKYQVFDSFPRTNRVEERNSKIFFEETNSKIDTHETPSRITEVSTHIFTIYDLVELFECIDISTRNSR